MFSGDPFSSNSNVSKCYGEKQNKSLGALLTMDFKPNDIARVITIAKQITIASFSHNHSFAHVKDMIGGI